ncbi:MAG: hypothetical protein WCK67_11910 [bacterium]
MQIINTLRTVAKDAPKYNKWEEEQRDKDAKRAYLVNNRPISQGDLTNADKFGKTIINAINIMDGKSEESATKTETATGTLVSIGMQAFTLPLAVLMLKGFKGGVASKANSAGQGILLSVMTTPIMMVANAWATSQQVFASKMARESARQNELSDPKNFILYDDEQLAEAKKRLEASGVKLIAEKDSVFQNPVEAFGYFSKLLKDKKTFKEFIEKRSVEDEKDMSAIKSIKVTPEQLIKAEREKETILRVIKRINNEAEDFSENIESATSAFLGMGFIADGLFAGLGALAGMGISKLVKLPGDANKILAPLVGGAFFAGGFLTEIMIAQNIKIKSAQVGRYKVKQELLSDPKNFISLTDKELEAAPNIKAKKEKNKSFFADFVDDMKFLFTSRKDFKAYNDYKKNILPAEKALMEELKKSKIKTGQLESAKGLQHKLFKSFEKVDDRSQEYSEDMEFATEFVRGLKKFLPLVTTALTAGVGVVLIKTKLLTKEKFTGFIAKNLFKNDENIKINLLNSYEKISKNLPAFLELIGGMSETPKNTVIGGISKSFPEIDKIIAAYRKNPEKFNSEELKACVEGALAFHKTCKEAYKKELKDLLKNNENAKAFTEMFIKMLTPISSEHKAKRALYNIIRSDNKSISSLIDLIAFMKNFKETKFSLPEVETALGSLTKDIDAHITKNASTNNFYNFIKGGEVLKKVQDNPFYQTITKNSLVKKYLKSLNDDIRAIPKHIYNPDNENLRYPIGLTATVIGGLMGISSLVMVPFSLISYGFNYAVESFFTSIQKVSGKIGVMEAINELNDPMNFIDKNEISTDQQTEMEKFLHTLKK